MSQQSLRKVSNKYLFDQTVSCENCKHSFYEIPGPQVDAENNSSCRLAPMTYSSYHYSCKTSRMVLHDEFCGSLGKFYEGRDK